MGRRRHWKAVFYTAEVGRCPVLDVVRGLQKANRVEVGHTSRLAQEEELDVRMRRQLSTSDETPSARA